MRQYGFSPRLSRYTVEQPVWGSGGVRVDKTLVLSLQGLSWVLFKVRFSPNSDQCADIPDGQLWYYWSLMRSATSRIPTAMPTFSLNSSVDAMRKKAPWSPRIDPSSNGATGSQMPPASSLWSIASSITRRWLSLTVIHTAPKRPASEPNSPRANAGEPNHETARLDPLAAHDPLRHSGVLDPGTSSCRLRAPRRLIGNHYSMQLFEEAREQYTPATTDQDDPHDPFV
jgi:hypothetical protein